MLVWGNQQPTWMASLPAEEQLAEIHKWFAAVAARYPNIAWLQVVNEPLHDPPDCAHSANQGNNCNASGNYARALGGANGTDGTGWDWILNAFRLAKQYFPNTKLMLNDYSITNSNSATTQYLRIINILKREKLIDTVGVQGHAFSTTGDMAVHRANLDRLAATGLPIQVTELDIDGVASGGTPGDAVQLRNYRRIVPTFWEHPGVEGITRVGLASAEPLAQRPERADRPLRRHAQARGALALQLRARDRAGHPSRPELHDHRRLRRLGRHRRGRRLGVGDRSPGAADVHVADHGRTATGASRSFRATGELRIARPALPRRALDVPLKVRVSDGYHESDGGHRDGRHRGPRQRRRHRRRRGPCPRRCRCRSATRASFARVHARASRATTRRASAPP